MRVAREQIGDCAPPGLVLEIDDAKDQLCQHKLHESRRCRGFGKGDVGLRADLTSTVIVCCGPFRLRVL
jgi:hypothetical protein